MANRIKELREAKGFSQEKLGEMANTTGQQIGKLEKGQRGLDLKWMSRISKALKVKPEELMPLDYRIKRIKIVGQVEAGRLSEPGEELEYPSDDGYLDVPMDERYRAFPLFALRVTGPSMNRVFPEGTVLICCDLEFLREDPIPTKRYIVRRTEPDGKYEQTVKELVIDEAGRAWLWPRSTHPQHQAPLHYDPREGDEILVKARVLWAMMPQ